MIDVLVMGRQPLALSIPPTPLQHSNTSIVAKMCFVVIDYRYRGTGRVLRVDGGFINWDTSVLGEMRESMGVKIASNR
jgi:hypothetical protein